MSASPHDLHHHLLAITTSVLLALPAIASEHQHESNACGHPEHDSLALRAQAATRTFWQDPRANNPEGWVRFKILGFNDFHGQLETKNLYGRPAGGAAVLASYLQAETAESKNGAIIVHAGDHVGASPPISALLQDEPSISFLNMLANKHCRYPENEDAYGNESRHQGEHKDHESIENKHFSPRCNLVGTLGNHEFDEGVREMQRLINGGIHAKGPFLDADYHGARFPYVVANVVDELTGRLILPPYVIKNIRGQQIAFIGIVLRETPTIVTPTGVAGVKFLDEATTINRYVRELKKKGVRAIVVSIHQGTSQDSYGGATGTDPIDIGGSIGPIISELDDEVDVVVTGHWHRFTNALVANKNGKLMLVTQAFSSSTAYADIDVAIEPTSGDIVEKSAEIVTTWGDTGPGLTPNPRVAQLVQQAATIVEPLIMQVIGTAQSDITRSESNAGESALGNLIADAQRAAMGTDIAFMNPGGIRADLTAGQVTWGDLFTIQPFNNDLVRMDLTGQQIVTLLNQQWAGQPYSRIMKPAGLTYTWRENDPTTFTDNSVDIATIRINGATLDPTGTYSVTVNSFMAAGGDNFTVLRSGTNRVIGPVDLAALVNYIEAQPQPFLAAVEGRLNTSP